VPIRIGGLVSKTKAFNENIGAFGWPRILPTAMAAVYCSVSKWTIKRAAASGALPVAGQRGRSMTFFRDDLDRWMVGDASHGKGSSGASPKSEALSRLRTLQRGAGR